MTFPGSSTVTAGLFCVALFELISCGADRDRGVAYAALMHPDKSKKPATKKTGRDNRCCRGSRPPESTEDCGNETEAYTGDFSESRRRYFGLGRATVKSWV